MNRRTIWRATAGLFLSLGTTLWANGSGLSVAVVVNQSSSNSVELGNYFVERRQVPPQNVIRINWTGPINTWSRTDFENSLRTPLLNALAARQLTNQIEFVVLSMDIPYKVTESNSVNGTTSAIYYGFKDDSARTEQNPCTLPGPTTNLYAGSEGIFRETSPGNTANTFLTTMITASNLATAKKLVDQGVNSDGTFPTQSVLLAKSTDVFRNIRFYAFDNTVFDTRLRGDYSVVRTNLNSPFGQMNRLGFQTGVQNFSVTTNTFVPGAMADHLTSFGGAILVPNEQSTLLNFINAGAAGSYGTVVEPCAFPEKFPSPQNYFYQARGFTLAECYYQSVTNPYQGIVVGEPLAAPFRYTADGDWIGLPEEAILSGTTNLSLEFTTDDTRRPVQQVDLFLDGKLVQTPTNIAPRRFNTLHVSINNHAMSYTVPTNATIKSVTAGLVSELNQTSNTNQTKVRAFAHGDRIELRSFDLNTTGAQIPVTVSNAQGSATALTTFIAASRNDFLDTVAHGLRSWRVTGTNLLAASLQLTVTKTNGSQVVVTVSTNSGTAGQLVQQLVNAINATNALQGGDGLVAEDFINFDVLNIGMADFNLRARSAGIAAAQVQAQLTALGLLVVEPTGNQKLDENLPDLQPRNHLHVTAGTTNLAFSFPFDTTAHPDGWHELTAVAYEGSHVKTQSRVTRKIRIENSPLSAEFNCLVGGSNTAIEATMQFEVVANTNNVTTIELFSTGGLLATATNQSAFTFAVAGTNLGLGLHPFYAVVATTGGQQYRTETKWIRLVAAQPFPLTAGLSPVSIFWPAVAGRSYDVLSADIVSNPFQFRETVVPTNSVFYQWVDPAPDATQRFYRVRVTP